MSSHRGSIGEGASENPVRVMLATDGDDSSFAGAPSPASLLADPFRRSIDSPERDQTSRKRRLSRLLPRRRKSRQDPNISETASRRSSLTASSFLPENPSRKNSDISITNHDGSGRSSLLTDDLGGSDDESTKPNRPELITHDSHNGYLTLSSPEFSTAFDDTTDQVDTSIDASETNFQPQSPPTTVASAGEKAASIAGPLPIKERLFSTLGLSRKKVSEELEQERLDNLQQSSNNSVVSLAGKAPQTGVEEHATQPFPDFTQAIAARRIGKTVRPASPIRTATPLQIQPGTPKTLVTPPTPTDTAFSFSQTASATFARSTPPSGVRQPPSSVGSIKHRRNQSSGSASKLSASIAPLLTPTAEETKTPGGTLTQPTSATGFFSSFFSSAQRAADQLNNSINISIGPTRNKSAISRPGAPSDALSSDSAIPEADEDATSTLPRAIDTLGEGNLSLKHLGIPETQEPDSMSSATETTQEVSNRKAEEEATARAISSAYEKPLQPAFTGGPGKTPSIISNDRYAPGGDHTPPRLGADTDLPKRNNSVRSKLSGRKSRHRNSSGTNSIAAALQSSTTGLANLQAHGPGHRLTGFAVASSRRNKDFHQLFRSVPEDDYLIEDYSAALQRDILLHGRLYVSEGHICFSSNILGWITNLVISFDEVVSVEKKSTAVIFPNAIVISTLNARNTFASFVARDSTYELLIGIWKINHPNLKSSLNGVMLDNAGTGDKTEVAEPEGSEHNSEGSSDDEVYDEDDDDDGGSFTDGGMGTSVADSEPAEDIVSRKPSKAVLAGGTANTTAAPKGPNAAEAVSPAASASADFPGPAAHAPSECTEANEHYDRPLTDSTVAAPLGKVYSLMFGPASGAFMRKWLVEDQKSRELNYADDKTGLDNEHKTFTFDYIKPLSAPVGPRQTKCITTNTLLAYDLEKAITIDCSTITPDVPSGGSFTTRTRYCLMWGPDNSTRIIATCTIEWSAKSWLKGAIEKGANDGQTEYVKSILAALKTAVFSKTSGKSTIRKGKRRERRETNNTNASEAEASSKAQTPAKSSDWGLFEPVHRIVEPIVGLVSPFLTSHVIIAVLFVLLAYTWLLPPGMVNDVSMRGYGSQERYSIYHDIWRQEESELWDWLDDRTGAGNLLNSRRDTASGTSHTKKSAVDSRSMAEKLSEERMTTRQMNDAIRVTEERLQALKQVMQRRQGA